MMAFESFFADAPICDIPLVTYHVSLGDTVAVSCNVSANPQPSMFSWFLQTQNGKVSSGAMGACVRSQLLRRFRSDLTRSLCKVKDGLGLTSDVLRTGFQDGK